MKRTQIQLDDATYETLRRRAFEQRRSMASLVRESLAAALAAPPAGRRWTIKDFTFVGMGIDPEPPSDVPVSEDHDRWYAEAVARRWEARRGADSRFDTTYELPCRPPDGTSSHKANALHLGVAMTAQVLELGSPDQIAREAERIYDELDDEITAGHEGEFMVVSVRTGKVYISPSSAEAFRLGREAEPNGLFHLVRIGATSAFKGSFTVRHDDRWEWPLRRAR